MTRSPFQLSRRDWLRLSAAGIAGCSMSGWLGTLAAGAAADPVTAGWLVTAADEEGSADLSRVKNAPRAEIGTGDGAVRSGSMLTYAEPHLAVQARIELIRVRLALANVAGP